MQSAIVDRALDVAVTLICWLYFTLGFLVFFSPRYLAAALFSSQPELAFQRLNRSFYRGFFALLRTIAPRQQWVVDERIKTLHSAVIVCNHLSYLDPLLLIALLDRSKTVVKPIFFSVPIFGWLIRTAGYFPATATGKFAGLMLTQMESMESYLAAGGNLFIFPEGTRGRDGRIGTLNQGALKIARHCGAPVHVLCLRNTDRLFIPGVFFFSTRTPNCISVRQVDHFLPGELQGRLSDLSTRIRQALESCLSETSPQEGDHNRELPSIMPSETKR
jgi:1-acyl-sn-glycerol-3-phosphate acyltransferase